MSALEVVASKTTNPGATITETTIAAGQTFAVRTTPEGTKVTLENIWGANASGGVARIRSPRMHDNVQGIRVRVPKADARLLLPFAVREPLYNQDTLIVETSGGGGETDNVYYLVSYDKLPGSEGNFKHPAEVMPRIVALMGAELKPKSGATIGNWGAGVALNSNQDQFKRPHEYALLGYLTNLEVGAVAFHGTDIGEVRVGGPGVVEPGWTNEYFIRLSEETGLPCIPCFQAGNVASILCEVNNNAAESEFLVTALFAQLS